MRIKDYRALFLKSLQSVYDDGEAESFFYLILERKLKISRLDLAMNSDAALNSQQIAEWNFILERLLAEVPIQYLLGTTQFYGLDFGVDENVLIPRPETEELVAWILVDCKNSRLENPRVLDIGTGSGCIAIALAKSLPHGEVSALDVSEQAIAVAKKNALSNGVTLTFVCQNILEIDNLGEQFDIMVSNPPYVRQLEKAEIKKNVLEHEPHLALFVDDNDALLFYRKIAQLALLSLRPKGYLYFEINQYLGQETVRLLVEMGFEDVVLKKDIYNNDRMIRASRSNKD